MQKLFLSSQRLGLGLKCGATLAALLPITLPLGQPAVLAAPPAKAVAQAPRMAAAEYVIGVEDVIEVRVRNHADLNRSVTVRPDGRITFPRAGEVQASGRTALELSRDLSARLERTLNNVGVEIEVKQARPRQARVIGAVKAPNAYKIEAGWRVADLVAAAGGLSARPERVSGRLVRAGIIKPFNITQAQAQPLSAANLEILPEDLVVLDESQVPNTVTVTGTVTKPGAFDLQEGLTVTKLMAAAGGTGEAAALRQAHVLRNGVPLPLDLSGLGTARGLSPVADSFRFQIGDVLVVPENKDRYGVLGQVGHAGYFTLPEHEDEATLLKALAVAGGPVADADLKNATITRMENGESRVTTVNIDAMIKGQAPDNVVLKADEVLFVPRQTAQVHIIGPVGKPGAYDLKDGMSLMSLISEAGIPARSAGLNRAYIQRGGNQLPLDLRSVLVEGKLDPAFSGFQLQAGDVLVIPDLVSQINVIGQVPRPGAYTLDDKLSVASLIAQVGNPLPTAALSQSYVLRDGQQIPLNLYRFLVAGDANAEAAGFKFQAGDVLMVPENKVRFAVLGQVGRPGYFPFPETRGEATVLKALAEAGGPAGTGEGGANLANAGIIRTVNGQARVIPVNISDILGRGNMGGNVLLQPEDILYIPPKKRGFRWTDVLGPLTLLGGIG